MLKEHQQNDGGSIIRRFESKYVIHPELIEPIRQYIRNFCEADAFAKGDPPEYVNTTLQFDTPSLSFHRAKEFDALNRFKLRARAYSMDLDSTVTMEIKKKFGMTIIKERAKVPMQLWGPDIVKMNSEDIGFRDEKMQHAFLDFCRLFKQTGAEPTMLVRYIREAYFSTIDDYARVTFDRQLLYQPTRSWTSWGKDGRWLSMDVPYATNSFSGVVLELKSTNYVPTWMQELIMRFDLVKFGFCKYSTAVNMEEQYLYSSI